MRPSVCECCAIRVGALCGALSNEELVAYGIARHKRIPAGQLIMRCDEEAAFFATVMSGVVKLTKTLSDSRLRDRRPAISIRFSRPPVPPRLPL